MVENTLRKLGRVGVIARFKPLHNGAANMLEAVCSNSEHVVIGIGSSNKYNLRNPFTAEQSEGMVRAFLGKRFSNYSVVHVPDFGHIPEYADGSKWKNYITENFGKLDAFVTSNPYVTKLLGDRYKIIHPGDLIPIEKHLKLRATQVRIEMARNGSWKNLVPQEIVDYLDNNKLVDRFQEEFGLQTLALLTGDSYGEVDGADAEQMHAQEASWLR